MTSSSLTSEPVNTIVATSLAMRLASRLILETTTYRCKNTVLTCVEACVCEEKSVNDQVSEQLLKVCEKCT